MWQLIVLGSLYLIVWKWLEQLILRMDWGVLRGIEHGFASLIILLILTLSLKAPATYAPKELRGGGPLRTY